jgi:hypothetical protein
MAVDVQKLIGEVAKQNHIVIEETDPIFAVMTINKLMMDEAFESMLVRVRVAISHAEMSIKAAEVQAIKAINEQVSAAAQAWKAAIDQHAALTGARAAEMIDKLNMAHSRRAMLRWGSLGLLGGLFLEGCGILIGIAVR